VSASPCVVDARGLEPPRPMQLVLEALRALAPGDELLVLLHREPYPLYEILADNGYDWSVARQDDASYAIRIFYRR